MLAQRQRELYSIQHRQRQLFQQKVMLMRQNMTAGPTGAVGTVRVPKGPPTTPQQQQQQQPPPQQQQQQQFNFPQGYNPMTGKPSTSQSHFSPVAGGPLDNGSVRVPLNSQALMGGAQGQFKSNANSSAQQGLFQQFAGSGEFAHSAAVGLYFGLSHLFIQVSQHRGWCPALVGLIRHWPMHSSNHIPKITSTTAM